MHTTSNVEKYFLFFLILIAVLLTLAIFNPFLTVIVSAIIFTVVIRPVYNWIKKYITHGISWLSSFITVTLFVLLLCIPLFFIGTLVFNETGHAYNFIASNNNSGAELINKLNANINKIMPNGFTIDVQSKVNEFSSFISSRITGFITSIFNSVLMFMLMIFTMFYLLKDGSSWKKSLIGLSPLSTKNAEEIISKLKTSINTLIRGSFVIAITQGLMVGIGLTIFGVQNGALWGVVAGISSFVPTLGTSLVTVPAILFLYFTGAHIQAVGMLIWATIMVGLIDNALSPYIMSRNSEISSLFILFAILGGIALMGPIGLFIGPLILSILYSLVSIYRKEIKNS